ncbi:MAG: hypothetical protein HYR51_05255 [Candidatus Rokubacteria bacterium]|nr:hypothetical protein [Candidatus Rokubacteria bacterium]
MPDDDGDRPFEELWAKFIEEYRRSRAPEGLRERIRAAIRAAAETERE